MKPGVLRPVLVLGAAAALLARAQNANTPDQGQPTVSSTGSFSGNVTSAGVVSAAGFDGGWVSGTTGNFTGYVSGQDAGFNNITASGILGVNGYISGADAGFNVITGRGKPVLTVLNTTASAPLGIQCGEKATSSGVVTITFSSETNGVAFSTTPYGCWCTNTSNTTENTCSTTGESATQVTLNGTTSDTYTWCCIGGAP